MGDRAGTFQRTGTTLTFRDRIGAVLARWAIGRMRYTVAPGLYAAGNPGPDSVVVVTANYKMSFDRVRAALAGRDAWILVLDTKGINVWCAAGKGTFGTDELVRRIEAVGLAEIVAHRRLVLPQLGASGVAAHEVKKQAGFKVIYGPVRAEDLPAFLDGGLKATRAMRRIRFAFWDRVVLAPVELVQAMKFIVPAAVVLWLFSGLGGATGYTARLLHDWPLYAVLPAAVVVLACLLVPALLPWLPGRAFALKGAWVGLAIGIVYVVAGPRLPLPWEGWWAAAGWGFLAVAMSSLIGMNFTGSSTFTSLSGVRKEMAAAVPLQILAGVVGLVLWSVGRVV